MSAKGKAAWAICLSDTPPHHRMKYIILAHFWDKIACYDQFYLLIFNRSGQKYTLVKREQTSMSKSPFIFSNPGLLCLQTNMQSVQKLQRSHGKLGLMENPVWQAGAGVWSVLNFPEEFSHCEVLKNSETNLFLTVGLYVFWLTGA